MRYNTGNPVEPNGSSDPRDLYDNSGNIDLGANGIAPTWIDRKGRTRKSWYGMERDFFDFIQNSGWESIYIQYAAGVVVQRATQLVQYPAGTGELFAVVNQTDLPLTLTGVWATDAPKLKSVGDAGVRAYIKPFIASTAYTPQDLDLTGVADMSAKVTGYANTYGSVNLPSGTVRMDEAVFSSRQVITGAGATLMNRVTKQWLPGGTTIVGTVGFTGANDCFISDMNVDAYATGNNALFGVNDATRNIRVSRVNSRANNHNHLWEANSSDAAGNSGGNIYVEDCIAYDGPNGFVTKMRNVTFSNCMAYDTTVQAFVVVSDNLNGPNIYSRAVNTRIINCGGAGNHQGVTVYSRDAHSEDNTYGVAGTQDTYIDVHFTDIGNCSVHVGFYTGGTAGFTRLYNDNVVITGGNYSAPSPGFHIRFDDAARPRVRGGYFVGANAIVYGDFCVDPRVSFDSIQTYGPMTGILAAEAAAPLNTAAVNVDFARTRLVFNNTTNVNVTLVSSAASRELDVVLKDPYTSVVTGGRVISGKNTHAKLAFDANNPVNGGWSIVSAGHSIPCGRTPVPFAGNLTFEWPSLSVSVQMTGNVINFVPEGGKLFVGANVSVTFSNGSGGNLSVFNLGNCAWGTVTPVTVVPDGKRMLLRFEWDGAVHVVTSVTVY